MNINSLLRELSGPRPLCRGVDIVSKPRIWGGGASAVSFEIQLAFQTVGGGKGDNSTYFNPTTCWRHSDTQLSSLVRIHDVEVLGYRTINLG